MKTYTVCTFESPMGESIPVQGKLNYEDANRLLYELLATNYGVEIIDDDPNNMEPTVFYEVNKSII